MISGYAQLFRLPGARAAALPAAAARLAGTMVSLALLLLMVSFGRPVAAAGSVSAAYAAGLAVGSPIIGRLMDRFAPARVLRVTGALVTIILGTTGVLATRLPTPLLVCAAFAAGLTTAPIGASMRALWSRLTSDKALQERAYAFEATLSELLFISGPTAVTLLAWWGGPRLALFVTVGLLGAGAVGYAQCGAMRARAPSRRRPDLAPAKPRPGKRAGGVVAVLIAIALTAALSTALAIAVAATLRAQGSPATLTGALMALQSVGSVIGGLVYGAYRRRGTSFARYRRLLVILTIALGTLPLAYAAHTAGLSRTGVLILLGFLLVGSGTPIAPAGAEEFQLIGDMAAQEQMTQAFAAVGSVIAIGGAVGSAVAGFTAGSLGPGAALAVPAVCTAAALLLIQFSRGVIVTSTCERVSAPPPAATPPILAGDARGNAIEDQGR